MFIQLKKHYLNNTNNSMSEQAQPQKIVGPHWKWADGEYFFSSILPPLSLENVSEHLQLQGLEVQESHTAIVKDLADVRHQAQHIYQKIGNRNFNSSHSFVIQITSVFGLNVTPPPCGCSDHSMLEFQQYQDQTSQYYTDLMNKLERMNRTLGSMLYYLDNMQSRVEERLHMIQGYLGWAGETSDHIIK